MEDLPLGRIAALVPEFGVKDLLLGRTLMNSGFLEEIFEIHFIIIISSYFFLFHITKKKLKSRSETIAETRL